ncbi:PAAR domain-containing protein [Parapedobacter tibetensis]|uniref:PAAR domain-containing protein n=1 Tax=Parapedobacter tibetensis TaxID=2972951 RepID=UPI00214DDF73|nr:PAAR domain-containing protein [Parapedobacter tibetensis]
MSIAARISDTHTCPAATPNPHVGGVILPAGCPTVLIGGLPAARLGDLCACPGPPNAIVKGSATVMIGGMPAARMGDSTAHGGLVTGGCPTVIIGG